MSPVLPSTWKVPQIFHSRLGEQAGRQRAMLAEGHLLLILHKMPRPGDPDRDPVLFWRDPSGTWKSTGSGSGLAELKGHLQEFSSKVNSLEEQMDLPPTSANFFQILQFADPLLRTVRNMHKALQEAREAVPGDRNILLARDESVAIERAVELLHADARNGMEYMIARQSEEQARNSERLLQAGHRLNILIAIFLPLTALGSAFGMNLRHGFEEVRSPVLFWFVLCLGLVLGWFLKALLTPKNTSPKP